MGALHETSILRDCEGRESVEPRVLVLRPADVADNLNRKEPLMDPAGEDPVPKRRRRVLRPGALRFLGCLGTLGGERSIHRLPPIMALPAPPRQPRPLCGSASRDTMEDRP